MIVVLGETYLPGTGGNSTQWHYQFRNENEFRQWEILLKYNPDYYDISYVAFQATTLVGKLLSKRQHLWGNCYMDQ